MYTYIPSRLIRFIRMFSYQYHFRLEVRGKLPSLGQVARDFCPFASKFVQSTIPI